MPGAENVKPAPEAKDPQALTPCLSPDAEQLRTDHLVDSDGSDVTSLGPESQIPTEFDSQNSQFAHR